MDKNLEYMSYLSQFSDIGYVIYNPEDRRVYISYNTYALLGLCPTEVDTKEGFVEQLLPDDMLDDDFCLKYKEYDGKKIIINRVTLDNSNGKMYLFIFMSMNFLDQSIDRIQEYEELNITAIHSRTIAHEIKNSLTVIKGFLQILRDRYTKDADFLNLMLDEVERANDLAVGFMRMTTLRENDVDTADVNHTIGELVKKMNIVLRGKHIIKTCFNDIPMAQISSKALEQVCLNLIQNSVEAIGKNGTIYVKTDMSKSGMIRVRVADNGTGIPVEIRDKIFSYNFTTKKDGTGYGLPIALAILQKYNSKLHLTSRVGKGSIFTILLNPEKSV